MSEYHTVSAYRGPTAIVLAEAIAAYAHKYDVKTEPVTPSDPINADKDLGIFSAGEWVVVLGPKFFNGYDLPLVRELSATHGWLASAVRVDDGNYWEHFAFDGRDVLHEFCSRPHFWAEEDPKTEARMMAYSSSPARLCARLGIAERLILPYLADADTLSEGEERAHPDDQFPLGDYWVFVDFWKRLGIMYPDMREPVTRVRLNRFYNKRLPNE